MPARTLHLPLAAALCLAALTPFSHAQSTAARGFGQGKAGGPMLTRAELRDCLAQQDRIRTQNEAAAREREVFDTEKAELVQQGHALKEQLAVLDRTSQEAVDGYNTQAAERDRRIEAFEARMPAFNEKAQALTAERDAFAKRCGSRRYDERDEIAIRKGR
jgi:hypothetical protein